MLDFIRVAAAVPDVAVGNAAENTDRIIEKADEAEKKSPQLTVFPELALTGYTCADLFFQQTLLRSAREGLKKIVSCSEAFSSVIAVGLPLEIHGALYNCAAVIYRGRLYGIVPKTYIPTYNEFYEKRWFTPGVRLGSVSLAAAELGLGEIQSESIPAGRDLIFDTGTFRFGAEICEDLWATVSPGSLLALGGAEVIDKSFGEQRDDLEAPLPPFARTAAVGVAARRICLCFRGLHGIDDRSYFLGTHPCL